LAKGQLAAEDTLPDNRVGFGGQTRRLDEFFHISVPGSRVRFHVRRAPDYISRPWEARIADLLDQLAHFRASGIIGKISEQPLELVGGEIESSFRRECAAEHVAGRGDV